MHFAERAGRSARQTVMMNNNLLIRILDLKNANRFQRNQLVKNLKDINTEPGLQ